MLVISKKLISMEELPFFDKTVIKKFDNATFDDIRWHRLRLVDHNIILLISDGGDISYLLKYLSIISHANIILISDKQNQIPQLFQKNIICLKPDISKEFFNGCVEVLQKKVEVYEYNYINFMQNISVGKFMLSHIKQVPLLSKSISYSYREAPQLQRGIFELLLNAFEHGVYRFGFDMKKTLISEKKYFSELNRRTRDPAFKEKNIELILHKKAEGLYININDPGVGFEFKPYLNFNTKLSDSQVGRGICYAANYCFDELIYKNNGSSVFAILKDTSINPSWRR